jgi:hypothetical protein
MVVWHTAVLFGPPPPFITVNSMPAGLLADARGLTGILGCYEKLLETYATTLTTVPPFLHPYPSIPRAFLTSLRGGFPSYVRWARERWRRMGHVPSILAFDLIGAEAVLAELEALTPAQLSAIEVCHRLNMRRLRQRSILGRNWRSLLTGLIGMIAGLVYATEYVGILKFKDIDFWSLVSGITMSGMDTPSIIARMVIAGVVFGLMPFMLNIIRFLPFLQRLQAFEDVLTITNTYRKGQAEIPKGTRRRQPTRTQGLGGGQRDDQN